MADSFWTDKKVLVGGGCGFLGSYVVPQLAEQGARLTVVDNLDNGYVDNIARVADQVEFIEADLREADLCDRVTRGKDAVINLAARALGMGYSRSHHGEMLVHNLLSGLTPLAAAARNGVERYMVVSSSCVYPDEPPVPTPELDVFTGLPESVNEGYGWAKRIQELAGTYFARERGMLVSIVRPFNLYGANYRWRSIERAHVIPILVKRIMDDEDPVRVWGSGNQKRNFLHGRDAAVLMLRVMQNCSTSEPVNIGYDEDTSIRELAELICEVSGRSPQVLYDTSKPEGCFRKCADPARLRALTGGYEPRVTLREGIAEMMEWYERWFGGRA